MTETILYDIFPATVEPPLPEIGREQRVVVTRRDDGSQHIRVFAANHGVPYIAADYAVDGEVSAPGRNESLRSGVWTAYVGTPGPVGDNPPEPSELLIRRLSSCGCRNPLKRMNGAALLAGLGVEAVARS